MEVTGFVFDTKQEIDEFVKDLFKGSSKVTLDEILSRADQRKFATQDLREYFIQTGKSALANAT